MSTYYYFVCNKCNKISDGYYTARSWGAMRADIIDCFQFVMKHTDLCGQDNIKIFSEHKIDGSKEFGSLDYEDLPVDKDKKTLDCYFPFSDDWGDEEWTKRLKEHRAAIKASIEEL